MAEQIDQVIQAGIFDFKIHVGLATVLQTIGIGYLFL